MIREEKYTFITLRKIISVNLPNQTSKYPKILNHSLSHNLTKIYININVCFFLTVSINYFLCYSFSQKDLKGGNYDPLTAAAAAAALNVPPSFLSYFSPLAAAAAAASSSSPSPSPTSLSMGSGVVGLGQQSQPNNSPALIQNQSASASSLVPPSTAAALSALMDPLGQFSKSAQLVAAAAAQQQQQQHQQQQQQQNYLLSSDVKAEVKTENQN